MTGRNHHTVGMGVTTEMATPHPGYHGYRPASAATLGQILQGNGYSTAAFGKWHQTPPSEVTASGPFTRWPTGEGFDKFYGFMGAEMNHWYPLLYDGTTPVEPDRLPEDGYHLTEDLVDYAISWLRTQQTITPGKPFFTYLALGATHAPFHVAPEWIKQLPRRVRPRLGRAARADAGPPEGARRRAPAHRARRRGPRECRTGTSSTRPRAGSRHASWRPTPASPSTPTTTWAGCSTRSRTSVRSTTRWSSTSSATTAPRGRADPRGPSASTSSVTATPTTSRTWRRASTRSARRRRTACIPWAGRSR